jgi:hypothetical protein
VRPLGITAPADVASSRAALQLAHAPEERVAGGNETASAEASVHRADAPTPADDPVIAVNDAGANSASTVRFIAAAVTFTAAVPGGPANATETTPFRRSSVADAETSVPT